MANLCRGLLTIRPADHTRGHSYLPSFFFFKHTTPKTTTTRVRPTPEVARWLCHSWMYQKGYSVWTLFWQGLSSTCNWAKNTKALNKMGQSLLHFLRRQSYFNIGKSLLRMFYKSVMASRLRGVDANKHRLIHKASDIAGRELVADSCVRKENAVQTGQCASSFHNVLGYIMEGESFRESLTAPKCSTEGQREIICV